MLGHHPLLQRKPRKSGRRAFATVLESERTKYNETFGNEALVSNTTVLWKLEVRVAPDGEAPFDALVDLARRRAEIGEIMAGGPAGPPMAGGPTILINGEPVQPAGSTGASATVDALTKLADHGSP